MAAEYRKARESNVDRCVVQSRPYLPKLEVDPDNEATLRQVVKELLGFDDAVDWKFKPVTGGISNRLVLAASASNKFLIRVFGAVVIDRDEETAQFSVLADAGFAVPYIGRFCNGRVEGWKEMKTLEPTDLPHHIQGIAQVLSKLHATDVVQHGPEDIPVLWKQLDEWYKSATESNLLDVASLKDELHWFRHNVPSDATAVFSHNDMLAGNILTGENDVIQLIDFEYSGLNYASFDIANHFNEWAGGTDTGVPDFALLPTEAQQVEFLKCYSNGDDVGTLLAHVQYFMVLNHLYWGLWAVCQAALEGCEGFDFLLYAQNRFDKYEEIKQQVLTL
jgi:ethanolamine kinase